MNGNETDLVFHTRHRREYRGCLFPAFLLAALAVAGLLMVINVRMPVEPGHKGVGNMYYRNDTFLYFQVRQRSPMPLNLPAYADPARQEPATAVETDGRVEAAIQFAPPFNFLSTPPDFAVFDAESLLELPPAAGDADQPAAAPKGEEVQP